MSIEESPVGWSVAATRQKAGTWRLGEVGPPPLGCSGVLKAPAATGAASVIVALGRAVCASLPQVVWAAPGRAQTRKTKELRYLRTGPSFQTGFRAATCTKLVTSGGA